jgi:hypothetical protein
MSAASSPIPKGTSVFFLKNFSITLNSVIISLA